MSFFAEVQLLPAISRLQARKLDALPQLMWEYQLLEGLGEFRGQLITERTIRAIRSLMRSFLIWMMDARPYERGQPTDEQIAVLEGAVSLSEGRLTIDLDRLASLVPDWRVS